MPSYYSSVYRRDPEAAADTLELEPNSTRPALRKVALAVGLLVLGCVLLFTGLGLYVKSPGHDGAIPLLVLGCITFLPGFYYSRIAYYAWRGYEGYSFNSIPDN